MQVGFTMFPFPLGIASLTLFSLSFLHSALPKTTLAQVQTTLTSSGLNTKISSPTELPNGTIHYDITGGTRPGNGPNLFHSFGEFSIGENNIANFLNETTLPTRNILSRVTGGQVSNIYGTIQTTDFPGAHLFLINPAGIIFGPTAELNVNGPVSFATADYLRMADGSRFHANLSQESALSIAPVTAFGFLGPNAGMISLQSSDLKVPEGQALTLVGGNMEIRNGSSLTAPSGRIQLASVASPGEIVSETLTQAPNINDQSFGALGLIQISEKSFIDASGPGGGTITLRGNHLVLNDSTIAADITGPSTSPDGNNLGAVTLSASTIQLENGATIQANAEQASNAGTITIEGGEGKANAAASVMMDNATLSATISGDSVASTPAAITVTADTVTLNNGTHITTETSGPSPAGNITFNVGRLTVKGAGPIRVQVRPASLIRVPASSQIGALIASDSTSFDASAGAAGQITIQGVNGPGDVAQTISIDDTVLHTRTFGGTAETVPAAITITADSVALTNRVVIYTTANGAAPAGNVVFNVNTLRTNLNPDGSFVNARLRRSVVIGSPSQQLDKTAGQAGAVIISGPRPESTDPAKLIALSNMLVDTRISGGPSAQPAQIIATAETAELSKNSVFVTTSNGASPAGNIIFNVDTLRINVNPDGSPSGPADLANRVFLNSPGSGPGSEGGPAGTIIISGLRPESTDPARLVDLYNAQFSTLVEGGTADLDPGSITIAADIMNMSGGTAIFSSTTGPVPAGNIDLHVNTLRTNLNPDGTPVEPVIDPGIQRIVSISSSSSSDNTAGRAGTVTISGPRAETTDDAAAILALRNARISTQMGTGGTVDTAASEIRITADSVVFIADSTGRNSRAGIFAGSFGAAPAGNIVLNVSDFSAENVPISSSSTNANANATGNAGNIALQSARNVLLTQGSEVTTSADQGSGGNITLAATNMIRLRDSELRSSVKGEPGSNAGNITIDPQFVIIQGSNVLAQANRGAGGIIRIDATKGVLVDPNSRLDATAGPAGISGSVDIRAPVQNLSGTIVPLTQSYIQAAALLAQRCAARFPDGKFSTFVQVGREGSPVEPGGFLATPLYMARPRGKGNVTEETALSYLGRDPTRALVWGRGCAY